MRITDVEVIPVAHREPPLRNSWGAHSELAARAIVRVTTADGERGVAEGTLAYSSVESMAAEYADAMAEAGRSDWLPNKPRW